MLRFVLIHINIHVRSCRYGSANLCAESSRLSGLLKKVDGWISNERWDGIESPGGATSRKKKHWNTGNVYMFEAQDLYMCVDVEHFQTMKELNHQFQVPVRCHSGLAVAGDQFWSFYISLWVWPDSYLISHSWYHGNARQESIHFISLLSYKQISRCSIFISLTNMYLYHLQPKTRQDFSCSNVDQEPRRTSFWSILWGQHLQAIFWDHLF